MCVFESLEVDLKQVFVLAFVEYRHFIKGQTSDVKAKNLLRYFSSVNIMATCRVSGERKYRDVVRSILVGRVWRSRV